MTQACLNSWAQSATWDISVQCSSDRPIADSAGESPFSELAEMTLINATDASTGENIGSLCLSAGVNGCVWVFMQVFVRNATQCASLCRFSLCSAAYRTWLHQLAQVNKTNISANVLYTFGLNTRRHFMIALWENCWPLKLKHSVIARCLSLQKLIIMRSIFQDFAQTPLADKYFSLIRIQKYFIWCTISCLRYYLSIWNLLVKQHSDASRLEVWSGTPFSCHDAVICRIVHVISSIVFILWCGKTKLTV